MGEVATYPGTPHIVDVIVQLQHAAILFEAHVGTMVVRTVILACNGGFQITKGG